jgi:hypothetical protein
MKVLKKTQECEEIHTALQLISTPSEEEVLRAVDKLRNSKAPGPDMIPAELLKVLEKELIKRLHKIIEAAWETERLPHAWKTSIICPIHKKGDILKCANCHGITLLNTAYKVFTNINQRCKVYAEELIEY